MANGNGWLWGIAGTVGGTVIGGLVLRGLGLGAVDARLRQLERVAEERHQEIIRRLERLELMQMKR